MTWANARAGMAAFLIAAPSSARAVDVPEGFTSDVLATELNAATAMAVAADGRVFIAEQTGLLRVWKDGRLLSKPALDLSERLDTYWERGLIGVALHPDFPHTPHLFVVYVAKEPFSHHVVSRFTVVGDQVDASSEHVLIEGDDQSKIGGTVPWGHQGGPLCFGPDGCLYLGLGEQTAGAPAQSLEALSGKILRLRADGRVPADNPFFDQTAGKYRAIWALGIRNPFGLAFQPGTARLFETDVGQTSWEEVNEIVRGGNYGWPEVEGAGGGDRFRDPIYSYPPAIGRSICGAAFVPDAEQFPSAWRGRFFFVDWAANWLKALDPSRPEDVTTVATGLNGPVAVQPAPDGSLLVLNRATIWRDGKNWKPNTGSLLRLRAGTSTDIITKKHAWEKTLGATGLFRSLRPIVLREEFGAFEINAEPWLPGMRVRRWISIPSGEALEVSGEGEFEFPKGTIVIQ
ncbi:MAG: PQQ-dependent sugar dehydrogenase [Chthoniobacteraceae bacterium]